MESKKICLIVPSLQMGGIERAMSNLANYFVEKGHSVHLVTLLPLEAFFQIDERIHLYSPKLSFMRKGMNIFQYIRFYYGIFNFNGYLRKTVDTIKPDTILDFCEGFPLVIFSLFGLKVPIYSSKRTSPSFVPPLHIRIMQFISFSIKKPDGYIVQTNAALAARKWFFGNNVRVIPNAARDVNIYKEEKQNWILAVGRLHKEKGYDRLLKAFARINAPDWKLVIAGGGEHTDYYIELTKNLKIDKQVMFLGKVTNIDQLLCKSKIFALPSYREGFPNALCEAMVAGLPCVSFDIIAGPSDIIQDEINGFLIKDGDINSFANKIQYLIDNPEVRDRVSEEAKKVKNRYAINEIGNLYLDFILNNY